MNARRLDHFASLLRAERERIRSLLHRIAIDTPAMMGAGAPGDDGDVGIIGVGAEDDAAVIARETEALHAVEDALRLIDESPDDYGICAQCGRPIPNERLELLPATRLCGRQTLTR
jgi:RNA polymerase-binding transcription factor DksA